MRAASSGVPISNVVDGQMVGASAPSARERPAVTAIVWAARAIDDEADSSLEAAKFPSDTASEAT